MQINPRLVTPLSHAAIIGFFFLPFVNIKCNHHDIEKVKGIELATGLRIGDHHTDSSSLYLAELDSIAPISEASGKSDGPEAQNVIDRNNYATAALILALCGLVLSFLIQWRSEMLQSIIGLVGTLSLMLMRIQLDQSVQQHASTGEKDIFNVQMSVEYLTAYWLAVVFFLFIAAINIFSYIEQARNGITEISDGIPGSG